MGVAGFKEEVMLVGGQHHHLPVAEAECPTPVSGRLGAGAWRLEPSPPMASEGASKGREREQFQAIVPKPNKRGVFGI